MPAMPRPKKAQKIAKKVLKNSNVLDEGQDFQKGVGKTKDLQKAKTQNNRPMTPRTAGYVR